MSSLKKRVALTAGGIVLAIAACKLAVHLYACRHYGYFVDELYYLACSRHLAWGYMDQPPLIALVAWVVRAVLGQSLPAIRLARHWRASRRWSPIRRAFWANPILCFKLIGLQFSSMAASGTGVRGAGIFQKPIGTIGRRRSRAISAERL